MSGRALPPIPGSDLDRPMTSVDFLLPTGIMVAMACTPRSTLREVKEQLYQEARKYPLFSLLKDQGFYNFMGECRVSGWAHMWLLSIKLDHLSTSRNRRVREGLA